MLLQSSRCWVLCTFLGWRGWLRAIHGNLSRYYTPLSMPCHVDAKQMPFVMNSRRWCISHIRHVCTKLQKPLIQAAKNILYCIPAVVQRSNNALVQRCNNFSAICGHNFQKTNLKATSNKLGLKCWTFSNQTLTLQLKPTYWMSKHHYLIIICQHTTNQQACGMPSWLALRHVLGVPCISFYYSQHCMHSTVN